MVQHSEPLEQILLYSKLVGQDERMDILRFIFYIKAQICMVYYFWVATVLNQGRLQLSSFLGC
jgi:hypothetical protein